jgi:hypothetical protein
MSGKVRLVVAVFVAVAVGAGGVPIAAQQQAAGTAAAVQGARSDLFASIQGTAVNWTNAPMANTPIRLRNARLGRVVDMVRTDRFGAFEFHNLEPGSYVAEMMNSTNDAVLASTSIVNVDSGQSVSVLIKLSQRTASPAAVFGSSAAATALAITAAAAAAGVLATSVAGAPATDRALPGQR